MVERQHTQTRIAMSSVRVTAKRYVGQLYKDRKGQKQERKKKQEKGKQRWKNNGMNPGGEASMLTKQILLYSDILKLASIVDLKMYAFLTLMTSSFRLTNNRNFGL